MQLTQFNDPLDFTQRKSSEITEGSTIKEALKESGAWEFIHSVVSLVNLNGEPVLESEFDTILKEGDHLTVEPIPQAPATLAWVAFAISAVSAVAALYMAGANKADGVASAESQEGSPTYQISSRGNRARMGQPKPRIYGSLRTWPDLSTRSYTEFVGDDDQIIYELFEVGLGSVDVDMTTARYEDTPLSDLNDVQFEVIPPGKKSKLFPSDVVSSSEVSSLAIKDERLGPYTVNEQGTTITQIACDVASAGIYKTKDNGSTRQHSVSFEFFAREVDDDDNPIGNYFRLGRETFTSDTRDPIRRTFNYSVEPGRYQVYCDRITPKDDSIQVTDDIDWSQLKGFLEDGNPITNTTRIAIKVRASEQLGNRSLSKFNVVSRGKVSTWAPDQGWTDNVTTSNPVWAFIDVAKSQYGGNRADPYIDLNYLYELALFCDDQGYEFNGVFDTQTTVWDALTKIAAVCRCHPVDKNGVYTMVHDGYSPQPMSTFTMRNIKRGSFKIEHVPITDETADGVRVKYLDKTYSYIEQEVLCALPGSDAKNVKEVNAFGVTDRDQAYLYGIYICAVNQYRRQKISFTTGLSGYLPFFHDVITVSHIMLSIEGATQISGDVMHWNGNDELHLSEPVHEDIKNPFIVIRNQDGTPGDPLKITVINDKKIRLDSPDLLDKTAMVWRHDANVSKPMFLLGEGIDFAYRVKVERIRPRGNNQYQIEGFVDDITVYTAADGLQVPPIDAIPDAANIAPAVSNLRAVVTGTNDDPRVDLKWTGQRADRYLIEVSTDNGASFLPLGPGYTTRTEYTAYPDPDLVSDDKYIYRVAGENIFRGRWEQISVDISDSLDQPPPAPTNLRLRETFNGPYLRIAWDSYTERHRIVCVVDGVERYAVNNIDAKEWDLHGTTAQDYGLGREFDVRVYAVDTAGRISEEYAKLRVRNEPPAQLNNFTAVGFYDTVGIDFDWPDDLDLSGVSVWMSTNNGFIPNATNLVIDSSRDPVLSVPFKEGQEVAYIRAAAVDVWGNRGLNFTGQYRVNRGLVDLSEIREDLQQLEGKFPVKNTDIQDNSISSPKIIANSVLSRHIISSAVTAEKIAALAVTAGKIAANAVTADKLFVNELSAIAASMGLLTAGTFQTTSGATPRVRITSSGNLAFWIGDGALINEANGHVYYNKANQRFVINDPDSGYRFEYQPGSNMPMWFGTGAKNANNGLFYYDKNARQLVIDNAKVRGDLEATSIRANTANIIDTLMLRGESITAREFYSSREEVGFNDDGWGAGFSRSINFDDADSRSSVIITLQIQNHIEFLSGRRGPVFTRLRLRRGSTVLDEWVLIRSDPPAGSETRQVSFVDRPGSGLHTYTAEVILSSTGTGGKVNTIDKSTLLSRLMILDGAKR
ncbi:host specificity factor TipJ family phage tail protein [Marinibactrum halimedae]|uniref:Tip attachment protein J domain-containing protein n=1 Tax=Marinibactrum halimedae TaxID=1444977 RepID=A0AA37T8Z5_9GAMM|nr:host specificity factor TipJ family phage tail protein [Marinibactrum halimedae]MCD9458880.1 phage tail protein [Marinibactrum halimedae]GLS27729.1 hypothetical protein GCM10007877_34480 [Marinibactrum halimedae]